MSGGTTGPLVGFDPGRSKCGLALTDPDRRRVVEACVLPAERALGQVQAWQRRAPLAAIVLGDGTGSGHWQEVLAPLATLLLVPEAGTTLAARHRYWELEPPRSWWRLLPRGLRIPRRDIDDVVARLLLERHLGRRLG
jgi:hypothetical protein